MWHTDAAALSISLPRGLRMDSNDLAGQSHSKVQSFRVPQVILKMLLAPEAPETTWLEALELVADVNADIYSAPPNWREKARIQSEFLAAQDSHTGRAIFLYMPDQSIPYDALAPGTRFTSCLHTSPTDVHKGEGCWTPSSSYPS